MQSAQPNRTTAQWGHQQPMTMYPPASAPPGITTSTVPSPPPDSALNVALPQPANPKTAREMELESELAALRQQLSDINRRLGLDDHQRTSTHQFNPQTAAPANPQPDNGFGLTSAQRRNRSKKARLDAARGITRPTLTNPVNPSAPHRPPGTHPPTPPITTRPPTRDPRTSRADK